MATKKVARKEAGAKGTRKPARGARAAAKSTPKSMPKSGKNPEGGLTASGRAFFAKKEGSHLRPGVTGAADTPEKMMRKGSFLRRHFTHPRGPMVDDRGSPTRLALSAHAWGEPVPKTVADARKLADKGHKLLEQYHKAQGKVPAKRATKSPRKTTAAKPSGVKKTAAKKTAAKKTATKKTVAKPASNKRAATRVSAKKTSPRKASAR